MNCPNCSYRIELGDSNLCPHCGVDMMLFTKIIEASDILYNKGLARVKTMDLTGAAECLLKSVQFNKDNYTARNLLGLIYYELGQLGDALMQWVISYSKRKEDNPAKDYLDATQRDVRMLDKYNDSIKMYNQALVYLKQKSDDMAIIQLKRAVEINPKFVNALNMLALCYLIQKDKTKALTMIERTLAIDANNSIALNYYNEVFPTKTRPDSTVPQGTKKMPALQDTGPIPSTHTRLSPGDKKSFGNTFHIAEILSFIIGGLCTFGVLYILVIPSMTDKWNEESASLKAAAELTKNTLEGRITSYVSDIETVTADRNNLRNENAELNAQLELMTKIQKINEADLLGKEGKTEEAAELLYDIDGSGLPSDYTEKYNRLKVELYPKAAKALYDEGLKQYNAKNYTAAQGMFEDALIYESLDVKVTGDTYYYLGFIAEDNKENTVARQYYEKVINEYPTSNRLSNAKQRLQNLN